MATETFRPKDRIYVAEHDGVPGILVGEHGTILTMHQGRGRQYGRMYVRVAFDRFTTPRTVPLSVLRRARLEDAPLTHMGVPISRDDADRISKDGP